MGSHDVGKKIETVFFLTRLGRGIREASALQDDGELTAEMQELLAKLSEVETGLNEESPPESG